MSSYLAHRRKAFQAAGGFDETSLESYWDLNDAASPATWVNGFGTYDLTATSAVSITLDSVDCCRMTATGAKLVNSEFPSNLNSSPMTVCGWLALNGSGFNAQLAGVYEGSPTTNRDWTLFYTASDRFKARMQDDATLDSCDADSAYTTLSEWKFLCFTLNSSSLLTLWVDAVAQADTETITTPQTGDVDFVIGGFVGGRPKAYYCDVSVWSRELSTDEISTLFTAGPGLTYSGLADL